MSSCNSSLIYAHEEEFGLYSGYWEVVKYDFEDFGEIDAEYIKDFATLFNNDEIIDYIYIGGMRYGDYTEFDEVLDNILNRNTEYALIGWIYYANGDRDFNTVESINNGISIGEMDFVWEDDLLVCDNNNYKMYLKKSKALKSD